MNFIFNRFLESFFKRIILIDRYNEGLLIVFIINEVYIMFLRERNLSSSETQKKRFDIINCEFYESYLFLASEARSFIYCYIKMR